MASRGRRRSTRSGTGLRPLEKSDAEVNKEQPVLEGSNEKVAKKTQRVALPISNTVMEAESDVRRSSRRRSGKSALELLGISPKRSQKRKAESVCMPHTEEGNGTKQAAAKLDNAADSPRVNNDKVQSKNAKKAKVSAPSTRVTRQTAEPSTKTSEAKNKISEVVTPKGHLSVEAKGTTIRKKLVSTTPKMYGQSKIDDTNKSAFQRKQASSKPSSVSSAVASASIEAPSNSEHPESIARTVPLPVETCRASAVKVTSKLLKTSTPSKSLRTSVIANINDDDDDAETSKDAMTINDTSTRNEEVENNSSEITAKRHALPENEPTTEASEVVMIDDEKSGQTGTVAEETTAEEQEDPKEGFIYVVQGEDGRNVAIQCDKEMSIACHSEEIVAVGEHAGKCEPGVETSMSTGVIEIVPEGETEGKETEQSQDVLDPTEEEHAIMEEGEEETQNHGTMPSASGMGPRQAVGNSGEGSVTKQMMTGRRKSGHKKVVKAVVITPSGERKEIKLTQGVSTIKALEQILAGTTSASQEDVAQLAADVSKQIDASIERSEVTGSQGGQVDNLRGAGGTRGHHLSPDEGAVVAEGEQVEGEQQDHYEEEQNTIMTMVNPDDKVAYEALSQLASGTGGHGLTVEVSEENLVDVDWLSQHGMQLVINDDQRWRRRMVGIEDGPVIVQMLSNRMRARPEKHVVASDDLKELVDKLQPDDIMENHVKHLDADYRLMECIHCGELLHDRHEFRKHINTHKDIEYKPWKCPICHYRAAVRAQIARHVNIHGELKPFVCKECGKGFNFKQKLMLHLKYHLDIRDRQCPYCELAFHEHKTLKNHVKKIHGIDQFPDASNSHSSVSAGQRVQSSGGSTTEEQETLTYEENTSSQSFEEQPDQETMQLSKSRRRAPHLYGTRKTFLYTQQYKMGLLPAADRNNVPLSYKEKDDGEDDDGEPLAEEGEIDTEALGASGDGAEATARTTNGEDRNLGGSIGASGEPGRASDLEKKGQRLILPKVTNATHLEPVLRKYCRVEKGNAGLSAKFFCELCDIEPFTSKTGFIHHLEQKHPDIRAWQCPECNYNCRMRSSLIVHMKLHTGVKDYECDVCGKAFAFKQKLKNHMKHHLNLREFPCHICDKAFNEKNDLTKHIKKVHKAERDCICGVCGKAFKDMIQVRRHMDGHSNTRYLCEICNKLYRSRVSLAQHMKSHTCMFHCEICDKNFGSYSGFMAHKVMHDESYEGYECEMCKKILHTKGSLTRHLAIAHSNERPHSCEECGKTFKTKKDLKNHHIVHTSERNFTCPICEFSCKRPESLRVHMRRHSDVKPFRCGVCGKEYTQKHTLETHMRHHSGKIEGSCPICGREFFTRYQLDTHIRRKHQVSILPVDNKEAVSSASAVGSSTAADKPVTVFMCEECNSVFMTQDSLAVHILAEHMKQGWTSNTAPTGMTADSGGGAGDAEDGVTPAGRSLINAVGSGLVAAEGESLEEAAVGHTVEVITEADGMGVHSKIEGGHRQAAYDGQHTVETLVSVSEPGSAKQRLVSLIHPVESHSEIMVNASSTELPARTGLTDTADNKETAVQKLNALLNPNSSGTVMEVDDNDDPHANPQETYVAITDPTSNQEVLVAMPHSNFESLLAATEGDLHVDGNTAYIATTETVAADDLITVDTAEQVLDQHAFIAIAPTAGDAVVPDEDNLTAGTTLIDLETGTNQNAATCVTVAETIEVPVETESVTVLGNHA